MSRGTYEVLKNKNFRFYISSRFFLTLAIQIQSLAVAWQVFEITRDPLSLGLIGLAEVIPAIGFALVAGYIVDRSNRRDILLKAQTGVISVCLLLFSLSFLHLQPDLHLVLIYMAVFMTGILRAFLSSSSFALFGQIVPREHFVKASAWNSTLWQVATLLGPASGGFLYGYFNADKTFLIAAALAICALIAMNSIPSHGKTEGGKETVIQSLTVGLRFVFGNKLILSALSLDLFAVLFGGAVALLPMFSALLNAGPEGLGLLRASPAMGAALSILFMVHFPPRIHAGKILLGAVAGFGLCMIAFAFSRNLWLSVFILALSGVMDSISVFIRGALLQLATPPEMRGRVSSVNNIFISSSNELGAFESGVAAKFLGLVPSVVMGGVATLGVVASVSWLSPVLRRLNLKHLEER